MCPHRCDTATATSAPLEAGLPPVVYERYPGAAAGPLVRRYVRREPENSVLYCIIRTHLETFLEQPRQAGTGYPSFIEREFRRYLDCGLLCRGFARVRCPQCGHERLLALSCKSRLCPSCWGRRMSDTAAHLVDRLLPAAPYRQWVLTFPYPLRFHLARDKALLSAMLRGFLRTLFAWQRRRGRAAGIRDGQSGAVTFIQRFGSALNLNPHPHSLLPDGLFVPNGSHKLLFVQLPPPTDPDVIRLTHRLARRLTAIARRYLPQFEQPGDDEQAALQYTLQLALRTPLKTSSPALPVEKPLCATVDGFSLHAARTLTKDDRVGLESLCRYGLRAPLSLERLSILGDGRIHYRFARPWSNGTGELVADPLDFMARLAALIPAPYTNLVRYHGVFANRSRYRPRLPQPDEPPATQTCKLILPPPDEAENPTSAADQSQSVADSPPAATPAVRPRRLSWASLLKRTLNIDALRCPVCATRMVILAFITDSSVVTKILRHLRLPTTPPPLTPTCSQLPPQVELFVGQSDQSSTPQTHPHRQRSMTTRAGPSRGPP